LFAYGYCKLGFSIWKKGFPYRKLVFNLATPSCIGDAKGAAAFARIDYPPDVHPYVLVKLPDKVEPA
jgi:hypothetical protein